MAYTPPGVTLTEVFRPSTVNTINTLRIPVIIGKAAEYIQVTDEEVLRGSTGLADNLAYSAQGIVSIQRIGSQEGLADYTATTDYSLVNDQVVWTLSGTSPAAGASYYVTYRYTRPASDYIYKEFTSFGAFLADMGPIQNDTQNISLMAHVMMKRNNVVRVGVIQVVAPYANSNFTNAIDLAKHRNVQDLVVLSSNATVQAYAKNHAVERSLPQNKRERIYWTGMASGTPVGDALTANSIIGQAINLRSENCVMVSPTRAKVSYIDTTTNLEVTATVNGPFIAGAVAGFRDQFLDPAQPIVKKQIQGMELFEEDLETYFTPPIMNELGGNGVLVLEPKGATNIPEIRDDVTTDTTTVERTELNVVIAKHYVVNTVRILLDATFIGRKIINREYYADIVNNYLRKILERTLADRIISEIVTTSATIQAATPRTVDILFEYIPIYSNKKISGEYRLTSG